MVASCYNPYSSIFWLGWDLLVFYHFEVRSRRERYDVPPSGAVLHPGWDIPAIPPDEELVAMHAKGELRLRRWQHLHFEDAS